ncbi:MAG: stage V sporulation protein AC [Defluviitaleaceae bacterium]|nr:stage V sporulation protein AC [Defluviitaleaceae bacterium]MCL2262952.1 stage V sporulation protein AC [Defluviitaleaceae bacterium]
MNATEQKKQKYAEMVKHASPRSTVLINSLKAFFVGGAICAAGQLIYNYIESLGFAREETGIIVAGILVASAALLTALRVYDKIAKFSGAGTIIPITGFANAIAAPAIEHKKEGLVLGVGAKMFLIAGPVIVYGTVTSVIVGLVYYFMR